MGFDLGPRRVMGRGLVAVVLVGVLFGCTRLPGASPTSSTGEPAPTATAVSSTSSPSASPPTTGSATAATGAPIDVDLGAIRSALIGPSPVPEGWEDEVDEIMVMIESALDELRLPFVEGLAADEAACATWRPLVGHQLWATGALLERQVFVAHLAQLVSVAPDAIRPDADEALRVASAAAAEQLTPGGDPDVIRQAPRDALRRIGLWAVERCELPVEAEEPPDTTDWTDDDIAYSCDLDRSSLERAMEDYRAGPGAGAYATHPHELEVSLEFVVYPAWHRIAAVDNEASPPSFVVEPIPGGFCDR